MRELRERYLMNTNMIGFRWFPNILYLLVLWTKVSQALGGLRINGLIHEDKQVSVYAVRYYDLTISYSLRAFMHDLNTFNAEDNFVQSTRMKSFLKTI